MFRSWSLPSAALVASVAGVLTLITQLPSGLRLVLLGIFVLAGPGSALVALTPPMERHLRLVVIPATGIALMLLVSTLLVDYSWWGPQRELIAVVVLTVVLALVATVFADRWRPSGGRHELTPGGASTPTSATDGEPQR